MLKTCSPYGYAFIIFVLCLVKRFTECMFLSKRQCYRKASYEKAIYFVNRSYFQDEGITYTQVTCDPGEENRFCKNWTTNHTSTCTKSNGNKTLHIEMPQHSFIIICPLRRQSKTYYHKARAFRKNSSLGESEAFREISINTCYCNWVDIRPSVSFSLPANKPFSLQLTFNSRVSKIKLSLATNSNIIPICEDKSGPFFKQDVFCSLENPIGCAEHSLVVRLESPRCINENYEFNRTIPKKLGRNVEIFENNFICNRYDDSVEIVPISFDESHTYFIKNPNNIVEKAVLRRRRIKLRGNSGRDIVIKVCKMNCICSQYLTLKNCHIKQTTQTISQRLLTVTLALVSLLLISIICGIILKKTRNKNTKAEEDTLKNIFDDSCLGELTQLYETQLQKNCQTVNAVSKYEDETFNQINVPHGNSL